MPQSIAGASIPTHRGHQGGGVRTALERLAYGRQDDQLTRRRHCERCDEILRRRPGNVLIGIASRIKGSAKSGYNSTRALVGEIDRVERHSIQDQEPNAIRGASRSSKVNVDPVL